jgi:hypothetical protein
VTAIPAELRELRQWLIWRREERDGKPTKVPYRVGKPTAQASVTDPTHWADYDAAVAVARRNGIDGIGFVFTAEDPYCGIDIDNAIGDHGLKDGVAEVLAKLNSYTEVTPSEHGLHVIVRATLNGGRHRTSNTPWGGEFEVYDRGRFFTKTGRHVSAAPATVEESKLDTVIAELLPPPKTKAKMATMSTISANDAEIIERATKAKNGSKFSALWRGEVNGYASESEADFALCSMLAFWTGPDPARIDSLFRRSRLMRDKWDSARGDSTYGAQTVARVLEGQTEFFDWSKARKTKSRQDGSSTPTPEAPASDPPPDVDGAELLADIRGLITRFMVLPSDAATDTLALWTLHTWTMEAWSATPYLHVRSPVKRAGKTRLLDVLELVCRNAMRASSITAAAVFQLIEAKRPTLLIDETDRIFKAKTEMADALVGVLNDGYRPNGVAVRGTQSGEPKTFSTWCAKVLAGIENSSLPDTVADRCIVISLERKLKSDCVERFHERDVAALGADIRDRCAAWAHHHAEALAAYRIETIEAISDRAEDIWEPLFAIADEAGGDWPARAHAACLALAGEESGDQSEAIMLLTDIRTAFADDETISTEALLRSLNANDESPWGARRNGLGLDPRGLARLLRPFRTWEGLPIKPKRARLGASTVRGYQIDQFSDVFARYLEHAPHAPQAPRASADGESGVADVADVADTGEGEQQRFACSCTEWTATVGLDTCQKCGGRKP